MVFFQDPFLALYGDADVENMSDGWDDDSVDGHTHELPMAVDDAHGPLRSLRYGAAYSNPNPTPTPTPTPSRARSAALAAVRDRLPG